MLTLYNNFHSIVKVGGVAPSSICWVEFKIRNTLCEVINRNALREVIHRCITLAILTLPGI